MNKCYWRLSNTGPDLVHHSPQEELNLDENLTGSGRNMFFVPDFDEDLDTTTVTEPITNTSSPSPSPSFSQHGFTKLFIYFSCILLLIVLCLALVNIRKSGRKNKINPSLGGPSLPVINNQIRAERDDLPQYNQICRRTMLERPTLETIQAGQTEDLVRVEI